MGQSVRTKIKTMAFALDARSGSTGRFLKSNRPVNAAFGPALSPARTTVSPWALADWHPAEHKRANINPRPTVRRFQQPALLIRAHHGKRNPLSGQPRYRGPTQGIIKGWSGHWHR